MNINDLRLFVDSKTAGNCLITNQKLSCQVCNIKLEGAIYLEQYSRILPQHKGIYCTKCRDKAPKGYDIVNKHIIVYYEQIPKNATVWLPKPPSLVTTRSTDVFEAALTHDGSKIVDKTLHAGRLSLEGSQVGQIVDQSIKEGEELKYLEKLKEDSKK